MEISKHVQVKSSTDSDNKNKAVETEKQNVTFTDEEKNPDLMKEVLACPNRCRSFLNKFCTKNIPQKLLSLKIEQKVVRIPGHPYLNIVIYHSKNIFEFRGPILMLIQSGSISPVGIWSPKLIIHPKHGVVTGSQTSLIEKAHNLGFGIILINTNEIFYSKSEIDPISLVNLELKTHFNESDVSLKRPAYMEISEILAKKRFVPNVTLNKRRPNDQDILASYSLSPPPRNSIRMKLNSFRRHHQNAEKIPESFYVSNEEIIHGTLLYLFGKLISKKLFIWAHQLSSFAIFYPLKSPPTQSNTSLNNKIKNHRPLTNLEFRARPFTKSTPNAQNPRRRHYSAADADKKLLFLTRPQSPNIPNGDESKTSSHVNDPKNLSGFWSSEPHNMPKEELTQRINDAWFRRSWRYWNFFEERVKGLIFTDPPFIGNLSQLSVGYGLLNLTTTDSKRSQEETNVLNRVRNWFKHNSRQYIVAHAPIGTHLDTNEYENQVKDIPVYSSGTCEHEVVAPNVIDNVFEFFYQKMYSS